MIPIKFFLSRVLSWAAKLSWSDFLRIVDAAKNAGDHWQKLADISPIDNATINTTRANHVNDFIRTVFPKLPTWAINLVRELAVAWLNRTKSK